MCETCVPTGTVCGNCGADPCYHLCFNSAAYYSPEQERHDDAFYGDDDVSERYAAEAADMRLEADMEAEAAQWVSLREEREALVPTVPVSFLPGAEDDIPF